MRKLIFIILFLFLSCNVYAKNWTADSNCVTAYLMEIDEDPLTDSSGEGNTAALKGAGEPNFVTTTPPKSYSTGYYDFAGDNDYLVTPYINFSTSSFTVVAWVKPTDTGVNHIYSDWQTTHTFRFFIEADINLQMRDGGGDIFTDNYLDGGTINAGVWQHVAFTWDNNAPANNDGVIYINGVVIDSENTANGDTLLTTDRNYNIGWKQDGSDYFNGDMDEFAIFTRALSITEINDIMNNGLTGKSKFRKLIIIQ